MNMLVRFSICTKAEQRSVIRCWWVEDGKGAELTHMFMRPVWRQYEWIQMFKNDWTNGMDADRSGRPSTSTTDEKQSEARTSIVTDRRPTAGEIASVKVQPLL